MRPNVHNAAALRRRSPPPPLILVPALHRRRCVPHSSPSCTHRSLPAHAPIFAAPAQPWPTPAHSAPPSTALCIPSHVGPPAVNPCCCRRSPTLLRRSHYRPQSTNSTTPTPPAMFRHLPNPVVISPFKNKNYTMHPTTGPQGDTHLADYIKTVTTHHLSLPHADGVKTRMQLRDDHQRADVFLPPAPQLRAKLGASSFFLEQTNNPCSDLYVDVAWLISNYFKKTQSLEVRRGATRWAVVGESNRVGVIVESYRDRNASSADVYFNVIFGQLATKCDLILRDIRYSGGSCLQMRNNV
ncbi:hypothetical protein C8R44DRAFT_749304 [Mycena epipterygia]|nr:hypothetical protein C8R44DRAFT_749304 [Mycena epipterygia]